MSTENISNYQREYKLAMHFSTQKQGTTPPDFMTTDAYIDFAYDPNRRSANIDVQEFEHLMGLVEEGEKSPNKAIQEQAAKYRKELETLEEITIEQEYGVTKEEYDAGDRGSYNTRNAKNNTRTIELLNELEKLDNASMGDVIKNFFTGELTKQRDDITKELLKLIDERDILNSKITQKAILTKAGREYKL